MGTIQDRMLADGHNARATVPKPEPEAPKGKAVRVESLPKKKKG